MSSRRAVSLALLVAATISFATHVIAADCAEVMRSFAAKTNLSVGAADEKGALALLRQAAEENLKECPDLEPLNYFVARAAELGISLATRERDPNAIKIAEAAAQRHESSARIAVIVARLDGSMDAARRAYALDAAYSPGRTQLALALAESGQTREALAVLSAGRAGSRPASEWIARSRVRLATGDAKRAIVDAEASRRTRVKEIEPTLSRDIARNSHEALGLALKARGRLREARPHLEFAASAGSGKASAAINELRKPDAK